ncbi:TPA: hypothetical protein N0F65_004156 [Lagenidium giganteum]|uniref:Uncharacterized protein n=1 Tax=Lagenidium giganteum TaxID=4803 RepID=A0AAV2ZEM9_9STRA|nr:TPA: hypothetical protein N0F65_004156 [Lagenidium giganteum]
MGQRLRKSFGSRVFWGRVFGCYTVGGAIFYKIIFDDGDVDILSSEETELDIANVCDCGKSRACVAFFRKLLQRYDGVRHFSGKEIRR